eukprot:PITA_05322
MARRRDTDGVVGLGASGHIFKGVNLEFEDVKDEDIHNPSGSEDLHQLKVAALKAANLSHAPYSKCPSGIALMTTKGDICTGFYIESAAFNPSLFPLQAGIIAFLCQDGGNYEDIVYAVLVEKEGAVVQQDVKDEDIHNPSGSEDLHQLKVAALKAANLSHAPYSKCPSGIALMTTKGDICTGFYIESAAFNPSLFPLQAGIIAFLCQDGGNYEDIVYAVLVEKEGVVVQQGDTIKLALKKFFPKCSFHLFNCYKE